jgi:hypothetical protein
MNKAYVLNALVGNAATLGIHWIYNPTFLAELNQKESLFFRKQDPQLFAKAQPSYYAYPHTEVGDVTSQGMFLAWLYQALKANPNLSKEAYGQLIYDHIKPGGTYTGYIETYGHQFIIQQLNEKMKLNLPSQPLNDDHLIGFVPYIAVKQIGLSSDKAWELAQLFTTKEEYPACYAMFDSIIESLPTLGMKKAIEQAIPLAPKRYAVQMKKAIEISETSAFVKDYAGTACAINQSVPIIVHLLYHTSSTIDAWQKNALISGAIAERAMLLTMISGIIDPPSDQFVKQLNKNLLSISLG